MWNPAPAFGEIIALLKTTCSEFIDPENREFRSSKNRLIRGSFWTLAGYSVYNISLLLIGIIAARILGKAGFGELGIIQSTIGVLGLIAGLGLGITATKFIAEFRDKDPEKVGNILALTTVVSLVSGSIITIFLFLSAPFIAGTFFHAPALTISLQISTGLIIAGAINGAQVGALSGFEAFRKIALNNTITGILLIPLTFAGLLWFGLNGFLAASVIGVGAGILLNHHALRGEYRHRRIRWSLGRWNEDLPILWQFSIPAICAALVVSVAMWIVNTLLINQPGGFDELGIFNAANQWRTILLFLPGIIALVSIPILAVKHGNEGYSSSLRLLKSVLLVSLAILVPTTALVCLLSPLIMQQYGAGFAESGLVLVLVACSALFMGLSVPVGNILAASNRMWVWFIMNLGWAIVLIAAAWLLLPWGALGLAGAFFISYFLHMVWTIWFAVRGIRASES
jgi:O-antigen/teichoic acid export membrane protein